MPKASVSPMRDARPGPPPVELSPKNKLLPGFREAQEVFHLYRAMRESHGTRSKGAKSGGSAPMHGPTPSPLDKFQARTRAWREDGQLMGLVTSTNRPLRTRMMGGVGAGR